MSKAAELAALIGSGQAQGNKNLIINGAMNVAQRGSVASATNGTYGGADRFVLGETGDLVATLSQDTDVPTGSGFLNSMKVDVTTADSSLAAGDLAYLAQRFEGQNLQRLKKGTSSAESVTLSFWVKSTITGTYIIGFYDNDNNRQISKSYTVSSADTWEHKTLTFAGDTTGAFGDDTGYSLQIAWWLAAGSTYTSGTLATSWASFSSANTAVGQVNAVNSASNNFYITGVQMEVGDVATPFEHEDYTTTLAKCRRYFIRYYGNDSPNFPRWFNPAYANDCYMGGNFSFPVQMRATPSVSASVTYQNSDGLGTGDVSREGVNLYVLSTGAATISGAYITNNSSDHVTVDAEL